MIKDISQGKIDLPHGRLTVSVDDLISIIDGMGFKQITASNNNIEFENIEDMKQHKSLLSGQPKLSCDNVRISFSRHWGSVSLGWKGDEDIGKAKAIGAELRKRKSILDKMADRGRYLWVVFVLMFFLYYLINKFYGGIGIEKGVVSTINSIYVIFSTFVTLFFAWNLYADVVRDPVHYKTNEGFIKRNFEKMLLALISAIIGAAVTAFFGWLKN